jgi:uncharacterized protein DUF3800
MMSWLLFMDESGHDHKNMPMEVRGGIALHSSKIWPFIQEWQEVETHVFGKHFSELRGEVKGSKLLETKRRNWAKQMDPLDLNSRHNGVKRFLTKKLQKEPQTKRDFSAYGQACELMASKILELLFKYDAVLFASLIPRGVRKPKEYKHEHLLRKDHIFLQERFFHFLEQKQEHGLFVMDQTEKQNDKRFVKRLHDYYTKTHTGMSRTQWIVPAPMFVDSEMSPGVQAADLCLYCINWGFRRREWEFSGPKRDDIHQDFAGKLGRLQFMGEAYSNGEVYRSYGIIYVPDPYTSR